MDVAPEPFPDAAAMQAELGARVAARRAAGEYPAGLEEGLDEHYRRVVHRPRVPQVASLGESFVRLVEGPAYRVPTPAFTSGMPGGTKLHAVISSTVVRHTQDLVTQLVERSHLEQDVVSWLVQVVEDLQREHEHLRGHLEVLYEEQSELRARIVSLEQR